MAYIELKNVDAYMLIRKYSYRGWEIYKALSMNEQINIGSQFIRSVDSVGANFKKAMVDIII